MSTSRPRRQVRPPGTLSDYLTLGEAGERSEATEEEGDKDGQVEDDHHHHPQEATEQAAHSLADKRSITSQPYKCRECKARYRSKVALLRHMVKHNGQKPFVCSECGKGLSSTWALSEHMNIHTNNRPHRCEECGLESRQLSVHLRHQLTHHTSPDNLFTCPLCSKTFKQNEYLRKHMRKHKGEKPFVCDMCEKAFTCKSELNRHRKRHSSERPHICSQCSQGFKMSHNLRKHLKTHSSTQLWKCLLCPLVFSKAKLLEAHRKTHQERIQHLSINRPDDDRLIISAEGEDRRRLPTVHSVTLPRDQCQDTPNTSGPLLSPGSQKKMLRINNTTLPLELILKSVGKGNTIKVKIIDKPSSTGTLPVVASHSIVELIDGDVPKQEGSPASQETRLRTKTNVVEPKVEDVEVGGVNQKAVEVASVLSAAASILSHCLSPHYLHLHPDCPEYSSWLATLTSFCQQLTPPLDAEVCKRLINLSSSLQLCLAQAPGSGDQTKQGSVPYQTDGKLRIGHCLSKSQYQFILKHYLIVSETIHAHFNNISNGE